MKKRSAGWTSGSIALFCILVLPLTIVAQNVVITEINYNSPWYFNPEDWIEFYNNSDYTVDISNWVFKDEIDTQEFVFPENTLLEPGEFIIMCADTSLFKTFFVGVQCYVGNFHYGLSGGGELIRLYNELGYIIDYLTYDDEDPWPIEPDGYGPSLELKDPALNNTLSENWRASVWPFGTPGLPGWLGIENDPPGRVQPMQIELTPAFPNPFNRSTTIDLHLPIDADVSLILYNSSGQQVRRLQSGWHRAGRYQITIDAAGLSSGVYHAVLTVPGVQLSTRLIYLK